ncbi:hypothetical protein PR048_015572 [Dryococelus australis]|uniref:Uncharacterized protein n=1 Tax=Dryococelus australis TaxID=614101 RepID=A0ABQ9HIC8_9NEOP|nr:hypothetical protein PR048_015572 [Dryococelus australis]
MRACGRNHKFSGNLMSAINLLHYRTVNTKSAVFQKNYLKPYIALVMLPNFPVPSLCIVGATSRLSTVVNQHVPLTIESLGSLKTIPALIIKCLCKTLILGAEFLLAIKLVWILVDGLLAPMIMHQIPYCLQKFGKFQTI